MDGFGPAREAQSVGIELQRARMILVGESTTALPFQRRFPGEEFGHGTTGEEASQPARFRDKVSLEGEGSLVAFFLQMKAAFALDSARVVEGDDEGGLEFVGTGNGHREIDRIEDLGLDRKILGIHRDLSVGERAFLDPQSRDRGGERSGKG